MDRQRFLPPPLIVLASGLVSTVVWVAVVAYLFGLPVGELQIAASGGLAGTAGAAGASVVQRIRGRKAELVAAEFDRVDHAARHDALTGLLNRAELFRQLAASLEQAAFDSTVVGVLFLDLNGFKLINDTLGHDAGDELLRIVADRLRAAIRSTDVLGRLGGDEFVVVSRGLLASGSVVSVADQVLRRFDEPVSLAGTTYDVGTSIGLAVAEPGDNRRAEELVRDADAAMYKAKRERLGYAVFDEAYRLQLMDRAAIERDLSRALDEEQFIVFYQPVVEVLGARLVGFEAYVRWNHPARGVIEPSEFLGVAQEAGMMTEIGYRVLRETCAQLAVWEHLWPATRHLSVGVNLSEQQLLDPSLARQIVDVLAWTGVHPSRLVVEVTEQLMAANIENLDALRRVSSLGVTVAIDGFGAGNTSFSYVKDLDMVTMLKIDRLFVQDLGADPTSEVIVRAILATARELSLDVVAEGVEHAEQAEVLQSLGVGVMQGYLFNEPAYADVIDCQAWFPAGGVDGWRFPGLCPRVTYESTVPR